MAWKATPEPATSGSNRACVTSVTSCPARTSPCPSPVYGATSPREPAVMIATRTPDSMASAATPGQGTAPR